MPVDGGASTWTICRTCGMQDTELDTIGLRYGDIVMCEGARRRPVRALGRSTLQMMIQSIHRIRAALREVSYRFCYYLLASQRTVRTTGTAVHRRDRSSTCSVRSLHVAAR